LATLDFLPMYEITTRYQAGETSEVLAAEYGCSQWSLRARFKKLGIASRPRGCAKGADNAGGPRKVLDEAYIVTAYNNYIPTRVIALRFGVHDKTVRRRLHELGVTKHGPWRHAVDDDYFETIDTEAKAYWLGMLMADGSVDAKPARHRMRLLLKDKEHVELFARTLQTTAPVVEVMRRSKKTGKLHLYYCLSVSSKKLVSDLIRHGVVPRKTCNHGTPELREDLMRHFYRGYVDGDGCIRVDEYANAAIWVTGHVPFLNQLQQWLMCKCQYHKVTKLSQAGRAGRLGIGGNRRVAKTCRLLYRDSSVSLYRKAKIARACIHGRDANGFLIKDGKSGQMT
jgi:intein-encoded DNA endonuclease-like protein